MDFKELSGKLDTAISLMNMKKKALDDISAQVNAASSDYQNSLNNAITLREQLDALLYDTLGASSTSPMSRVKKSA